MARDLGRLATALAAHAPEGFGPTLAAMSVDSADVAEKIVWRTDLDPAARAAALATIEAPLRLAWFVEHAQPGADLAELLGSPQDASPATQAGAGNILLVAAAGTRTHHADVLAEVARYADRSSCMQLLRTDTSPAVVAAVVARLEALEVPGESLRTGEVFTEVAPAVVALRSGCTGPFRDRALEGACLGLGTYLMAETCREVLVPEALDVLAGAGADTQLWCDRLAQILDGCTTVLRFRAAACLELLAQMHPQSEPVRALADAEMGRKSFPIVDDNGSTRAITFAELAAHAGSSDPADHAWVAELFAELRALSTLPDFDQRTSNEIEVAALQEVAAEIFARNTTVDEQHLRDIVSAGWVRGLGGCWKSGVLAGVLAARPGAIQLTAEIIASQRGFAADAFAATADPAALVDAVLEHDPAAPVAALMIESGLFDPANTARMSVATLTKLGTDVVFPTGSPGPGVLFSWIAAQLGGSELRWRLFCELGDDFDGTVSELLALVMATEPAEVTA